nr:hypothetical protein [Tanacetum cinerariifolium]
PPRLRGVRKSVRPPTPMATSTQALIDAFAAGSPLFPLPPTSPAYDQAPLGHRADMISESFAAARAPRSQYDFVDTVKAGQGLICSLGHDAQSIVRAANRAEDFGYVRALHASERRMMTSIEEVNLRVSYQAQVRRQESTNFYTQLLDDRTDRRDITLEIDVVSGQRTTYKMELHEVHQAYLSFEAQNRALLARLETLETHVSRMEWQRQSAEDLPVTQMMCIHALEARAWTDTVEDASSSCYKIMPATKQGTSNNMTPETVQAKETQPMAKKAIVLKEDPQGPYNLYSPAYIPDPMELDEHVPTYVPEPEHPEYHAPSDDDIQVEDQPYTDDASSTAELPGYIAESDSMEEDTDEDSLDYPDEPKDGEEDEDEDLE